MATDAHQINFHAVDIHRNFTNCLCSICVEEHLTLAADLTCNTATRAKPLTLSHLIVMIPMIPTMNQFTAGTSSEVTRKEMGAAVFLLQRSI